MPARLMFVGCILCCAGSAAAKRPPAPQNTISVSGFAEVTTIPNQFVIRGAIQVTDKSLSVAFERHRKITTGVIQSTRKLGVPRRYIAIDRVRLSPKYSRGSVRGYELSKAFTVILHDAKRIGVILRNLAAQGVTQIRQVSYHDTKTTARQLDARRLAVLNAKRRAEVMAAALGKKLGPPSSIEEATPSFAERRTFTYKKQTPNAGPAMAVAKVRTAASVRVTFVLGKRLPSS